MASQAPKKSRANVRLVPRQAYPLEKESKLFSHLELGSASVDSLIHFNERAQQQKDVNNDKDGNDNSIDSSPEQVLHPAFVQLGMDYATGQIIGTYRRCHAFLEALYAFLGDMRPIEDTRLSNRLITYINAVVQYLDDCRAVPLPFDNIISKCQDIIDQASREFNLQKDCIRAIRQRIGEYMEDLESQQAETVSSSQKHLKDGDVVLTFGHSEVVVNTLLEAQSRGLVIKVIVIDSKPLLEGKKTLHILTLNRFECEYALITALQYIMPQVSKVLLGAHAVLSNGALLARSGSALTALCAKRSNKPVLVCCEAFKFVKQAYIDGICHNELGPPINILLNQQQQRQEQERVFSTPLNSISAIAIVEDGINNIDASGGSGGGAGIGSNTAPTLQTTNTSNNNNNNNTKDNTTTKDNKDNQKSLHIATAGSQNEHVLTNWTKIPNLKLLNLRFDLTPANYISALITNYDTIPPSSASVIVRESLKRKTTRQNDTRQTMAF